MGNLLRITDCNLQWCFGQKLNKPSWTNKIRCPVDYEIFASYSKEVHTCKQCLYKMKVVVCLYLS